MKLLIAMLPSVENKPFKIPFLNSKEAFLIKKELIFLLAAPLEYLVLSAPKLKVK